MLLTFLGARAQEYRVTLEPGVPAQAAQLLQQRMEQMLQGGGLTLASEEHIQKDCSQIKAVTVKAVVTSRMETPGSITQIAITADVVASCGEVSETFTIKGVGADDDDAWLRAVKQFLPRSKAAQGFTERLKAAL